MKINSSSPFFVFYCALIIGLFPKAVFAMPFDNSIQCTADYQKNNSDGSASDFIPGTPVSIQLGENKTWVNRGFSISWRSKQICAADSGPCTSRYESSLSISNAGAVAHSANQQNDLLVALTLGLERMTVYCETTHR